MAILLYRGLRGSRLHGFATPDSDWDYIEIWNSIRSRQSIRGDQDIMRMGFSEFAMRADKGSPEILECIFSPDSAIEFDMIRAWRYAFRPNIDSTRQVYRRTIKNFEHSDNEKQRRHARRLAFDLECILTKGYFDPAGYSKSLQK